MLIAVSAKLKGESGMLTPLKIDEKRKELAVVSKQLSDLANTPEAKDIPFAVAYELKAKADEITKELEMAFSSILAK